MSDVSHGQRPVVGDNHERCSGVDVMSVSLEHGPQFGPIWTTVAVVDIFVLHVPIHILNTIIIIKKRHKIFHFQIPALYNDENT